MYLYHNDLHSRACVLDLFPSNKIFTSFIRVYLLGCGGLETHVSDPFAACIWSMSLTICMQIINYVMLVHVICMHALTLHAK